MPGQLFTHYFLNDGIRATPEWRDSVPAVSAFRERAAWIYEGFKAYHAPNEAVTEQDLVRPPSWRLWAGPATCPSRAANATRTSRTISCLQTLNQRPAPPAAAVPRNVTWTPC